MKYIKSIICFLLCIVLLSTSCLAAGPQASGSELLIDLDSVYSWNTWLSNNILSKFHDLVDVGLEVHWWNAYDTIFSYVGLGSCASRELLNDLCNSFNFYTTWSWENKDIYGKNLSYDRWEAFFDLLFTSLFSMSSLSAEVAFDANLGVWRLRSTATGYWFVNRSGHFPYYRPENDTPEDGEVLTPQRDDLLLGVPDVSFETVHRVSKAQLGIIASYYSGAQQIENRTHDYTKWVIRVGTKYVCDADGFPYAYVPESQGLASDQAQDVFTEAGSTGTVDDGTTEIPITQVTQGDTIYKQLLNIEHLTVNPDFSTHIDQYIDKVLYDSSTKTYFVDSHDKYTYNSTTNQYETNNYRYEITYNLAYTSVTYIGSTGEYTERYDYYYQLPDGRSSADLTASDLEQLSTVFVDVVNYARSTDDAGLRALYHFDGDTLDSSYWSYAGSFDWLSGASLTYLESGAFGGCLYLDELTHSFRINLPTDYDTYQDFTLQFRYYQSHTEAPSLDASVAVGSKELLRMNGSVFYDGGGTNVITDINTGTWNEICIMRCAGIVYYYVNGVYYDMVAYDNVLDSFVRFTFGDNQQTYKYIDELRFSVGAIYEPTVNYTCSSVPFDSNLALILPDGEVPIPDSVPKVVSSSNNILTQYGLDDWTDESIMDKISGVTDRTGYAGEPAIFCGMEHSFTGSSVKVTSTGTYAQPYSPEQLTQHSPAPRSDAIYIPTDSRKVGNWLNPQQTFPDMVLNSKYCFTIVFDDLSYVSYKFTLKSVSAGSYLVYVPYSTTIVVSNAEGYFSSGSMVYDDYFAGYILASIGNKFSQVGNWNGYTYGFEFYFPSATTKNIIHMELVPGTAPEFSVTYETSYYSSGQLQESPVLAARTNDPIAGYQIGGVRPVYPEKGLVYALVENGFITSLQQYNGTAWVQINGRIWTGSRWIPYSSYNVLTMQEFIDIYDSSGSDVVYIYTEQGFWGFMQTSMNKVINLLERIAVSLSGEGDDSEEKQQIVINITQIINEEDDTKDNILDSFSFLKRIKDLLFFDFDNSFVDGFFNMFTDENSGLFDFFSAPSWAFDPEGVTSDVE